MLINKNTRVMDKAIFEYVVKDYNETLAKLQKLNAKKMSLKEACDVFNGHNFTPDMLFDFNSTWFLGTVIQMDGYLELSSSVEIYDLEGDFINQYDINELVKFI